MRRVIGHDGPSGDAGRPRGHSIWLNCQGQQILAAPEQLRWATPEDILAWNIPGDVANEVGAEHRTKVTYADVRWKPTFPEEAKENEEHADAGRQIQTPTRLEELEAKTALIAEGQNHEACDRLWIRLLAKRSGQIKMAYAAKAEGMPVSKTLEKQLGRRKGKPGRRELRERDIPKHLKEALDEAKKKEWSSWLFYDTVEILNAKQAMRTDENNLPVKLKARLVVLGNLEKDSDYPRGSLLRANVPFYGPGDAARGWWKKAHKSLLAGNWKMRVLELALFYLRHDGYGKDYEESLKTLQSLVDFDQDEVLKLQHCGKTIEQSSDATVEIGQKECAKSITQIQIAPSWKRLKAEPYRSQQGRVVALDENGNTRMYVIEWKSQAEKRVCRNTLAAETYALAKGTGMADWLRSVLLESRDTEFHIAEWESRTKEIHAQWMCDAKSVVDHLSKDVGTPQDKRVGTELAALKQLLARGGDELRWVDTSVMLADPLTKGDALDDEVLQRVLCSSEYNINASTEMKEFKGRKAAIFKTRRKAGSAGAETKQHASSGGEQEATRE
ncbi:unnamed protein product [Prorocentrum cordatum]|uniref:Uncharacterized protein n=1 Tax=Prorocentrum cordatum TaxID=2364126 RepID=A0ABN9Y2G9_9DINO|nr:unnamed protein product [Polarella glacialis]